MLGGLKVGDYRANTGRAKKSSAFFMRPLKNSPFCPISVSGSNFNPQNTQCMSVVKIFAFLELEQKFIFFKGLITKIFK